MKDLKTNRILLNKDTKAVTVSIDSSLNRQNSCVSGGKSMEQCYGYGDNFRSYFRE